MCIQKLDGLDGDLSMFIMENPTIFWIMTGGTTLGHLQMLVGWSLPTDMAMNLRNMLMDWPERDHGEARIGTKPFGRFCSSEDFEGRISGLVFWRLWRWNFHDISGIVLRIFFVHSLEAFRVETDPRSWSESKAPETTVTVVNSCYFEERFQSCPRL